MALGAVWLGGVFFLLLVLAAVAVLAREWSWMSLGRPGGRHGLAVTVFLGAGAAAGACAWTGAVAGWAALILGAAAAASVAAVVGRRPGDAAFGVLYIGAPCLAAVWLREGDAGLAWTLTLFAATWAADVAAFLVGSQVGGPKLWPRLSPNKTWSGFAGGLAGAALAALAVGLLTDLPLGPESLAAAGLLAGFATMAGDLLESLLKRRYGVKDSGRLIPGHGGLLDRVDGLMLAALAVAAIRLWAQGGPAF